jgi:hypothetical protein
MGTSAKEYIEPFMAELVAKNPGEIEFHQAAMLVANGCKCVVEGANIAGFMTVADAMLAQGIV